MAGEWLKLELNTADKPEVLKMARILKIDKDAVLGKLVRVWAWFDKNTVDGVVDGVVDEDLDDIALQVGFCNAMATVGWLEYDNEAQYIKLPKFDRHNGQTAKNRALKNERQARWRASVDTKETIETSTNASTREEKRREDKPILKTKIVLLDDGTFEGLESHLPVWENAYPSLDVIAQIRKAGAWCKSNTKRAPKSDFPRFLNSWLSRANENVSNDDPFAGAI
jgi:DNA replication protein DnaT